MDDGIMRTMVLEAATARSATLAAHAPHVLETYYRPVAGTGVALIGLGRPGTGGYAGMDATTVTFSTRAGRVEVTRSMPDPALDAREDFSRERAAIEALPDAQAPAKAQAAPTAAKANAMRFAGFGRRAAA